MLKSKKYKLLVRMMEKVSALSYAEVELKKDGVWSPKAVFCNVYLANVLSVETKLDLDEW